MTISISSLSDAPPSSAKPAPRSRRRHLRAQDVLDIVESRRTGESAHNVAAAYYITKEAVRLILNGQRRGRLPDHP